MGANYQLHAMARRHHATMQKLDSLREIWVSRKDRLFGTLETGAGAWIAGMVKGRTEGPALGSFGKFATHPLTLGTALLALGYLDGAGHRSDDVVAFGNGYVSSFFAAKGFEMGARMRGEKQTT